MAACGRREGLDRDGVDRGGAREKASEWRSRLNAFTVFFGLWQRHVGGGFLDPLVSKAPPLERGRLVFGSGVG